MGDQEPHRLDILSDSSAPEGSGSGEVDTDVSTVLPVPKVCLEANAWISTSLQERLQGIEVLGLLLKVRHAVGIITDGSPTRLKHRKKRRHAIGGGGQCWIRAPFQQLKHEIEASVQGCHQQGAGCVGC